MKASLQHLRFDTAPEAVHCYWVRTPKFGFHWHYHPELEITYVHQGQGIRMVGDNVSYFQEGDFVFLGSNLPHTWISDDDFNQKQEQMEVVVLQFSPNLFSREWLDLSEMIYLKRLFQIARHGIIFSDERRKKAINLLLQIVEMKGFERYHQMLRMLNYLGQEDQPELLATKAYIPPLNTITEQRLLKVCQYIHDHFTSSIRLDDVAGLANMNASAFCRFFRKSTGQTYMEYVTDLRIGKACNLLLNPSKLSISEIAYRSGFNSQTLFNRSFLKKKQMTPSAFRNIRQT